MSSVVDHRDDQSCRCTSEGYAADCPQSFTQNGVVLHSINEETRLKPRKYHSNGNHVSLRKRVTLPMVDSDEDVYDNILKDMEQLQANPSYNSSSPVARKKALQLLEMDTSDSSSGISNSSVENGPSFPSMKFSKEENTMLVRHKSAAKSQNELRIDGQSIAAYTIGGFQLDMSKAAQKVSEIAPLPASKLPIIFKNETLNFYHHFIQGMEVLFGRDRFLDLVDKHTYVESASAPIAEIVLAIMQSGFEKTDSEITTFVKKVLLSTFDKRPNDELSDDGLVLIVSTNLWDFQYISPGMQMNNSELSMWLQINYNYYKTLWFNTFKSSGVPEFSQDGVQTRYSKEGTYRPTRSRHPTEPAPRREYIVEDNTNREIVPSEALFHATRDRRHRPRSTRDRSEKPWYDFSSRRN